ncbi:MAG: hypothetical protein CR978_02340 [Gammaproteobacteria bacterium]|nr:MAG: hypothetical protein CR978_02340 [Gammaproteobacteria bacterium]
MRKDKEKVLDEVWTDERVRAFLEVRPQDDTNPDAYVLALAYRNMRIENFTQFVGYFCEQNRDVNARDKRGQTLLDILKTHRHGAAYAEVLRAAGAV